MKFPFLLRSLASCKLLTFSHNPNIIIFFISFILVPEKEKKKKTMEPLCPNFDLLLKSSRPTSIPLFSHPFSCMNRGISRKSSVSLPCASYNHNHNHRQAVKTEGPKQQSQGHDLIKSITKGFVGFAAAATALASVYSDSPAFAESLTVAFPVSRAEEVNTVQRTLVEAWGLIRETFVDPTFNHQDWDLKLQQTMVEMFPLKSADAAYGKIKGMLSTLGDPFTRIISPKEYQSFRIGSDGNLQGVGLFMSVEPKTGHLVVLSCVDGSPAARAGIHEGDELIEINGQRLDGVDSEAAAQRLRGKAGTSVTVKLHTVNDSGSRSSIKEVKLPRELIRLSPISSTVILHRAPDGRLTKTGYVKLLTFSQTAATDMENTIYEMENQGVQSYILDLRNNPVIFHSCFCVLKIFLMKFPS
ncbi:hypothetical protein REPUB_Repub02eG0185400 [Reevesia pubescens]